MGETYEAIKKIARGQFAQVKTPATLSWHIFIGQDGAIHCKSRGTATLRMKHVWKVVPVKN